MQGELPMGWELPAIRQIVKSQNPFHPLSVFAREYGADVPNFGSSFQTTMATIHPRAIFLASTGTSTRECHNVKGMSGEILSEPDDAGKVVIFIPGYGFCWGQTSGRSNKRMKTASEKESVTSSCSQLVIHGSDFRTTQYKGLAELLGIIGTRLRGLKFSVASSNTTLARVFELCPNLESLRPYGLTASSLDVVRQAYSNGVRVSSLSLLVDVESKTATELHKFLRSFLVRPLAQDTAAYHLKRLELDFGQHLSRTETTELLEQVLMQNNKLTHFIARPHRSSSGQKPFDGRRIPGFSDDQEIQLLTILGGMRAVAVSNPAIHMDGYVKQLILESGVTPRYHRVLLNKTGSSFRVRIFEGIQTLHKPTQAKKMVDATMDAAPAYHAASAASGAPAEWLFLSEWFRILGGAHMALAAADMDGQNTIRIGYDDEDDAVSDADVWLEVVLNPWHLGDHDAYDCENDNEDTFDNRWPLSASVEARVATLRDAIVLTSIVGKTDYSG